MTILKWNSRNSNLLLSVMIIAGLWTYSCKPSGTDKPRESVDSKQNYQSPSYTLAEGKLTVLMDNSFTSYFIHKGHPLGFEYEMIALFAKENNLNLKIKVVDDIEHILDSLNAGMGDMVAANLTPTKPRLEKVSFTKPLFRTQQVLVQRTPDNSRELTRDQIENSLIRDRLDLDNDTVVVRKSSSYEMILESINNESGINIVIDYAPKDYTTELLIEMVANKKIDFTICDQNKAKVFNTYYQNIDIKTPVSLSQPIAWATNKGSTKLLDTLNHWIEKRKGSLGFNMIEKRYFDINKRKAGFIKNELENVKNGQISKYDDLIKKYAAKIGWDWRLLAAQIYRESKFDQNTKSWRGATGLMQLMPATAKSYGVNTSELKQPERNLEAGTLHLKALEDHWKTVLTDSMEILKFTLGSYNVGQGHVEDAIRLADKYGAQADVWDDNIADMLLKKSMPKYFKDPVVRYGYCRGKEPVKYVSNILENYSLYKQFKKQ